MRVLVACKRGGYGPRDKWGHCLCDACKQYKQSVDAKRDRSEYCRQWRQRNRDKCAAYTKKWNSANRSQRREIERSWKSRNPDKVKAASRKAGSKWAKNNKAIKNEATRRRTAAKLCRTPRWANRDKMQEFYFQADKISKETGIPHEVDHIAPLQGEVVCGLHNEFNLQVIPRSCNRSKHNRMEVVVSAS